MATLQEQLQKSKKLSQKKLSDDLYRFIRTIEKEILDKNKEQIEFDSEDIFGNALGYFSKATEMITGGRKKAGEPFTGKETGDWFKGFYMQEVSGVLRINSKDPKTIDILRSDNWLSNEVFGLSDENLKAIIEEKLLPFFIKNSKEILDI